MIVASMATVPRRRSCAELVVRRILPMVDRLNVYLNHWPEVPGWLRHRKIVLGRSQKTGNLADGGKFFWVHELGPDDYHFTIDDDIHYPENYVRRMRSAIDRFEKRALLGVLGYRYDGKVAHLRRSRVFHVGLQQPLARPQPVNVIGTGTLAYHASAIRLVLDEFPRRRMPDIAVAIAAQKQHVPMVAIDRPHFWLRSTPEGVRDPKSLFAMMPKDKDFWAERIAAVRACEPWRAFRASPNVGPPPSFVDDPPGAIRRYRKLFAKHVSKTYQGDRAILAEDGVAVWRLLERHRPSSLVDCGLGFSSLIFRAWAAQHDAETLSTDHDPRWIRHVGPWLGARGYPGEVQDHERFMAHQQETFDVVLVDHGPSNGARLRDLPRLVELLNPNGLLLLDDFRRDYGESARRLLEARGLSPEAVPGAERMGFAIKAPS